MFLSLLPEEIFINTQALEYSMDMKLQ